MNETCTKGESLTGEDCAFQAFCLNDGNCVCKKYFIRTGDFSSSDELDCIAFQPALYAVYSLNLFLILLSLYLYLSRVKRRKQLLRLGPYLLGMTVCLIVTIYKLVDDENSAYGENIPVTIAFSLLAPLSHVGNYIVQQKYLTFQNRIKKIMSSRYEVKLKAKSYFLKASTILSFIGGLVFVSSLFFIENEKKEILIRSSFGILGLAGLIFSIVQWIIALRFARDLKNNTRADGEIKLTLYKAKEIKKIGGFIFFVGSLIYLTAAISTETLYFSIYTIPVQIVMFVAASILVLRTGSKKIEKRFSEFNNQSVSQATQSIYRNQRNLSTSMEN